jgi:tetratricopeptide (TPR) repeat protein
MRLALAALTVAVLSCGTPPAPDPDQARFRRAYDLTLAGKENEALELYRAMLRPDAGSRYQPEAHLAFAELAFKQGDFATALEHYRAVEGFAGAPTRPYAIYKEGWVQLDLGDTTKAREAFERVIALEHDETIPEAQRKSLVEAARDGLVKAFARAEPPPEEPAGYFQKKAGPDAPRLLESLAQAYADEGQWDRSAALSRELIAAHVDSPRLCEWQGNIVRAALASGTQKEQLAEVQRLGAVLARLETGPAPAGGVIDECRGRLRDTTRQLALLWHEQAERTKDPSLMELADPLFRQYLARFGAEKDSHEMTFFHAQALGQLGRWAEASDEYRRAVELDPAGPHVREAAYGAVLAAKNAAEREPPAKSDPTTGLAPQPLSPGDRRLLSAFELYIARVPSSPELPAIEYRRARLLYDRNHFEEALPFFRQLVERHPESELAIYGGNLYLDSLNVLGRRRELCQAVRALLAGPLPARDAQAQKEWRRLGAQCPSTAGGPAPKTK